MTTLSALPTTPSLPALGKSPTAGTVTAPVMAPVSREEIEWAKKLDKKMEYGYVPDTAEQERYNKVVGQLTGINEGWGIWPFQSYAGQGAANFMSCQGDSGGAVYNPSNGQA